MSGVTFPGSNVGSVQKGYVMFNLCRPMSDSVRKLVGRTRTTFRCLLARPRKATTHNDINLLLP
eukprot:scaffold333_cov133-Cylindrotheca_fusiformis.AAC.16